MIIARTKQEYWDLKDQFKEKIIGFIPTMGFLHEGHLSLIKRAKAECDITVVSIFVNPTQFNRKEDLDTYPIDLDHDFKLLKEKHVDIVFVPQINEIYGNEDSTKVFNSKLANCLEGKYRPGHFEGVCTVVLKLFNIIRPEKAYFGKKDFQQLRIIEQMTSDLFLKIQIIGCDIHREKNGLAMSSRNVNLTDKQKEEAGVLYRSLKLAKNLILNGEKKSQLIIGEMKKLLRKESDQANLEYISINQYSNLDPVELIENQHLVISMAVFFGKTRLIDNLILNELD